MCTPETHNTRLLPLVALVLCWTLGGPEAAAQSADRRGGEVIYGEVEPVTTFDPYLQATARGPSDRVFSLIYEPLMRYNYDEDTNELVLVESWTQDGQSLTLNLRRNVVWHDGLPFTADDVVFTYEYIKRIAPAQISDRYGIVTMEAVDKNTVRATLPAGIVDPFPYLNAWIIPAHRFRDFLPAPGREPLDKDPEGTGPYRFEGQSIEGHVSLSVNEAYWGDRANLDRLTMIRMTEPQQELNYAIFGGHNLIRWIRPGDIVRLEESSKFRTQPYASLGFYAFAYNTEHPILQDKRVRQALTMATNRQQMLDQWFNGRGEVVAGPFNSSSHYFDPSLKPLSYDPARAVALLEQAGYGTVGSDGVRVDADGRRLSLEVINFVEDIASETLNQNIFGNYQHDLQQVGVEVRAVNLTLDAYQQRLFRDNEFEVALINWTFDPIYDVTDLFHSRDIGGNNIVRYRNIDVDRIIEGFNQADDAEVRRALMQTLQRVVADENPYTFLFSVNNQAAFWRGLASTRIAPYYFFSYYPEWYVHPRFRTN